MVTTIHDVELRHILNRLRVAIAYIWRGSGTFLKPEETWDDVVVWTDSGSVKPTEQEMIAEWDIVVAERTAIEDDTAAIETELSDYDVQNPHVRIALELISDLTKIFINGQNPSPTSVYAGFATRLNGSSLESAIKNYVTMRTSLTSFGTSIPVAEKQLIMGTAHEFLQSVLLVWLAKKQLESN